MRAVLGEPHPAADGESSRRGAFASAQALGHPEGGLQLRLAEAAFDGAEPRERDEAEIVTAPSAFPESISSKDRLPDRRYATLLRAGARILFPEAAGGLDRLAPAPVREHALLAWVRGVDESIHAHMLRVGLLAGLVALQMGLPLRSAREAAWHGSFHDMGKMRPEILSVVNKPGKLDAGERLVMERHTLEGAAILLEQEAIPARLRRRAAKVALEHHESADGTGYPLGLMPEDTFPMSRIVAVADFFDALLENRPYREGMKLERALEIMSSASAKLDPPAFRALRALLRALD